MSISTRAEHIGSFLRSAELLQAHRQPNPNPQHVRALEDAHIQRVLSRQKDLGFQVFTDCDTPRSWASELDFVRGNGSGKDSESRADADVSRIAGVVTSRLHPTRRLTGHELSFLLQHSPGHIKMTLPSVTQFPAISFKRGVTDRIYKDHSDLIHAIVEIMKAERAQLSRDGVN